MKQRGHEYTGKKRDTLIENISLGFSSVLGIAGVVAGAFIPGATLPIVAIQAGAYCPAIVAATVKGLVNNRELLEKIDEQINSCAKTTAKEYLTELKKIAPTMYKLFQSVWDNDEIYKQNSSLDSIAQRIKEALTKETK